MSNSVTFHFSIFQFIFLRNKYILENNKIINLLVYNHIWLPLSNSFLSYFGRRNWIPLFFISEKFGSEISLVPKKTQIADRGLNACILVKLFLHDFLQR